MSDEKDPGSRNRKTRSGRIFSGRYKSIACSSLWLLLALQISLLCALDGVRKGKSGEKLAPSESGDSTSENAYDQLCGTSIVEKELGNEAEAVQGFASAVGLAPNVSVAWYEIGAILGSWGVSPDAERSLLTSLRLNKRDEKAIQTLRELRAGHGRLPPLQPSIDLGGGNFSELNAEQRAAKEHQSRYKRRLYERYFTLEVARRRHTQQLAYDVNSVGSIMSLATIHTELLDYRKAVELYQQASVLRPGDDSIFIRQINAQIKGCVFDKWDDSFLRLEKLILSQVSRGQKPSLGAIESTVYPLSPAVGLAICRFLGTSNQRNADKLRLQMRAPLPPVQMSLQKGGMLSVSYVTSHFTSSSIGREMLFLVGAHDPTRIAVSCYAINSDDGSWLQHTWRENIARACSKFVDLSSENDVEAARIINAGGAHILLDLNGWSGGHRETIIALRPAAIQVRGTHSFSFFVKPCEAI
jgi:tetratricopeptide (TPR) repeat protein